MSSARPTPAAARRLRDAGRADAALACYDKALSITPDAGLYFEVAALAHAGQMATPRAAFGTVRLVPSFGDGHFELGNVLHGQSRFAEAAASFKAALDQAELGDRGMVLNNFANALTELGDEQGAETAYARGLQPCRAARPPPFCSTGWPTSRAHAAAWRPSAQSSRRCGCSPRRTTRPSIWATSCAG